MTNKSQQKLLYVDEPTVSDLLKIDKTDFENTWSQKDEENLIRDIFSLRSNSIDLSKMTRASNLCVPHTEDKEIIEALNDIESLSNTVECDADDICTKTEYMYNTIHSLLSRIDSLESELEDRLTEEEKAELAHIRHRYRVIKKLDNL